MESEIEGVNIEIDNDSILISLDYGETNYHYSLSQIEEIQGRLIVAGAKLRGKLAKEATSQ